MSLYKPAVCIAESDGLHYHEYWAGKLITEHLHTWIDQHLINHPTSSRVYIGNQAYAGTAAEAWTELTGRQLPDIDCQVLA